MLKEPVAVNIHLQTLIYNSHQALNFNRIKMLRLPASFINTLCTRSEINPPILMEKNKNKNHQITLPKERIGFSSLDVVDRDEPKYQIRSPYELTNANISTDERYND